VLGAHDDRVEDESVLVLLDLADHLGLLLGAAVVVDDSESSEESHEDGHVGLGDSVHGGGNEGELEGDLLGDLGVEGDLVGGETDVAGEDEEIIVAVEVSMSGNNCEYRIQTSILRACRSPRET
jgi:hypothetical protein